MFKNMILQNKGAGKSYKINNTKDLDDYIKIFNELKNFKISSIFDLIDIYYSDLHQSKIKSKDFEKIEEINTHLLLRMS